MKNCPFCGGETVTLVTRPCSLQGANGYRVECESICKARTTWWHTKQEAIDNWNMRMEGE
jgi:Lar family restriction alleviation protein